MASWQQVGLGGIDSDGGILSKNSWRGPQLQITPSYSCLSSTRGGGGLGLAGTRAFDALGAILEYRQGCTTCGRLQENGERMRK